MLALYLVCIPPYFIQHKLQLKHVLVQDFLFVKGWQNSFLSLNLHLTRRQLATQIIVAQKVLDYKGELMSHSAKVDGLILK
jgi:hypothetical protein